MAEPLIEFTLHDRHGVEHQYVAALHPAESGMLISAEILALMGGVAEGSLTQALQSLSGTKGRQLMREILRFTSRDDHPLSDTARFNAAFTGNYGELYSAVVEVAAGNGFLPELGGLLGKIETLAGISTTPSASGGGTTPSGSPT